MIKLETAKLYISDGNQAVRLPIVEDLPNAVTRAAIEESERLLHDTNAKTFSSMEKLRADLLSDEDEDNI